MKLSDDGHLLQKVVRESTITRQIDWQALGITPEYVREQSRLKDRKLPILEDEPGIDRYYVTDMCMPYHPPPDDRDVFVYYYDIQVLSGTAGYLRIRDGYVYGRRVIMMS